jgi:DNA-binding MarR family transcriptional regulator
VEIRRDERDARAKLISLTDAGRSLLGEAVQHWQAVNDAVVASLGDTELSSLRSALRTIAAN